MTTAARALRLLLPALIPSWRFFDFIGPSPRIEYALLDAETSPVLADAHWRVYRARRRAVTLLAMLRRLFWNAPWNEALYAVSCAERLLDAPASPQVQALEVLMMRRIVDHLDHFGEMTPFIAIRIVLLERTGNEIGARTAYVSSVHGVSTLRQR